ncbi:serine/threonine-protein kinase DCLK1-like isoform X2 [Asterias rubens]|uniref:serine/threonine-protein kinase DCLK1-like isoform X2 n=1 Tax=Asterias rubens TaxID=7604 RepID=UPI001455CE6F|nr:serine/threonine-protein kinase DCLK1-like isoform X2 [Asterias rubens]
MGRVRKNSARRMNTNANDTLLAYPFNNSDVPPAPAARARKKLVQAQEDNTMLVASRNSDVSVSQQHKDITEEQYQDLRRPRQLLFYRNGDRYFRGKRLRITPNRFQTFETLLSELTKHMSLPYGVRKIYQPDTGVSITDIENLKDGESYVCASFEKFKKMNYGANKSTPGWATGHASKHSQLQSDLYGHLSYSYPSTGKYAAAYARSPVGGPGSLKKGGSGPVSFSFSSVRRPPLSHREMDPVSKSTGVLYSDHSPSKPKLCKIAKAGAKPPQIVSLLLNKRSVQSYEQLVQDISDAFGLPKYKNHRIRKLFTISGKEVKGVADFFRNPDDAFIASTSKHPLTRDEVAEVYADSFPNMPYTKGNRRRTKGRESKTDSSLEDDERSESLSIRPQKKSERKIKDIEKSPRGDKDVEEKSKDEVEREEANLKKEEELRRKEKELKKREEDLEKQLAADKKTKSEKERLKAIAKKEAELKAIEESLKKKEEEERKRKEEEDAKKKREEEETERRREEEKRLEEEDRKRLSELEDELEYDDRAELEDEKELFGNQDSYSDDIPSDEINYDKRELNILDEDNSSNDKENKPNFSSDPREIVDKDSILKRYTIGPKIGDGNFADVHEATLKNTDQVFAMKIVDKSKLTSKEHMIENEIGIMKNIKHPNIAKLFEEHETEENIYLVMEYIKGGDLFDAITESVKFTEADAAIIISDMASALAYLHGLNIVHRDLKPENLLISKSSSGDVTLKLADFGLAMEVKSPIFTVCGTPTYVAPEILAETGYGLEVDMWATGVICYILLCGFPPFRSLDRDQEELFEIIQSGEFVYLSPYWDNISDSAKDLIDHLLVVSRRKRYTAKQVMKHPWITSGGGKLKEALPNLQREVSMNLEKNFEGRKSGRRKGGGGVR